MPGLLELTWYGEGSTPSDPIVVCGTCAMGKKEVQNAGRAFWENYELPLTKDSSKTSDAACEHSAKEENEEPAETERERAFREKKEKRKAQQRSRDGGLLKLSEELKGRDLYELLEVEACATSEDLKKSYRKLVLVHHPDKLTDPTDEQRKHFLLIQEAFEIISDPEKKRRYESTIDFDDSIPEGFKKGNSAEFFNVFGPVFKRNARWSSKPRVPELGDEETAMESVKRFYDFWHNFDSWRDPLAIAEQDEIELHNLEEAECREERRWMERENAKIAKKIKQCERDRIAELVRLAEKHDPRMIAHRENMKAQKEGEKARRLAAKEAEKRKLEEEAKAAAEAEEAARAIEEQKRQAERKVREEQKQALKAARQRVRNLHKNAEPSLRRAVHMDQLQEVCIQRGTDELDVLAAELEIALGESGSCTRAIELLHAEIRKTGGTPIEDDSVKLKPDDDNASTLTPDSSNEEEIGSQDGDDSPQKAAKELSPQELEAERLRVEAEDAAEQERRAKKAEEQRKKKEQKRKEEEKRQAAQRKLDAKERKAQEKAASKEVEKLAVEQQKVEEKKAQQITSGTSITVIAKGTPLLVEVEGPIFESPTSYETIGVAAVGSQMIAAGPPVDVDGYGMVPVQPRGTLELRIVKVAPAATTPPDNKANDNSQEASPKKAKKAKEQKQAAPEEDLDAILTEFGIDVQSLPKEGKKKKGKK